MLVGGKDNAATPDTGDILEGGQGDDTYILMDGQDNNDLVVELENEGVDQVLTDLSDYTLTENVENLTYIGDGAFAGHGNDLDNVITGGNGGNTLDGGAGYDTLIGGDGDDTLDGGLDQDEMYGGAGDDTYIVDDAEDDVVENEDFGNDTVRTTLNAYELTANVENLVYEGSEDFHGTGNSLDNVI